MSYIRIDNNQNMNFIPEHDVFKRITEDEGIILVVTGESQRSKIIHAGLKLLIENADCNQRDLIIRTASSRIMVRSEFKWENYMGLQLSSAYIHRDADINFLLRILSKCRYFQENKVSANLQPNERKENDKTNFN